MVRRSGVERRPRIVLAAGGTGGHLFPAQALGEVLGERGYAVHLMTDDRASDHLARFPAIGVHVIPSATVVTAKPLAVPGQLLRLARGYLKARRTLAHLEPAVVVGFGGYPSIPPLIASMHLKVPIVLHEQNAVMGRANRFIAAKAQTVATAFPKVERIPVDALDRVVMTGNPVREAVRALAASLYAPPKVSGEFRLLVFGGSQGARVFADIVPEALAGLPFVVKRSLRVVHQAREEDLERVDQAYFKAGIAAEVKPFYGDLAQRMAEAHLVIARAGASTVSELGVIGRPAILVPLPHSLEGDQLLNARQFTGAGGGFLIEQPAFTVDRVAGLVMQLRYDDQRLKHAAEAARHFGRPDAAMRLADLVEGVAREASRRRSAGSMPDPAPAATVNTRDAT